MNCMLLYLALLCQTLPMIMRFTMEADQDDGSSSAVVVLSRASSFIMLFAYLAFLIFHLFSSHLSPPPPQVLSLSQYSLLYSSQYESSCAASDNLCMLRLNMYIKEGRRGRGRV